MCLPGFPFCSISQAGLWPLQGYFTSIQSTLLYSTIVYVHKRITGWVFRHCKDYFRDLYIYPFIVSILYFRLLFFITFCDLLWLTIPPFVIKDGILFLFLLFLKLFLMGFQRVEWIQLFNYPNCYSFEYINISNEYSVLYTLNLYNVLCQISQKRKESARFKRYCGILNDGEFIIKITSKIILRCTKRKTTNNTHFKCFPYFSSIVIHWNDLHRCLYCSKEVCHTRVCGINSRTVWWEIQAWRSLLVSYGSRYQGVSALCLKMLRQDCRLEGGKSKERYPDKGTQAPRHRR